MPGGLKTSLFTYLRGLFFSLLINGPLFAADNQPISEPNNHQASRQMNFLTWENYVDPQLIAEFEQQTHSQVRFIFFEDDDERDMILANSNGHGFDLVLLDHTLIDAYQASGWLLPINTEQLPHLTAVYYPWSKQPLAASVHAVPYFWGSIGIVYRADLVDHQFESWLQLFRPSPQLHQRIQMLNTAHTSVALALKALGYPLNSKRPQALRAASNLLKKQAPAVKTYRNIALNRTSGLLDGSLIAAVTYNGDAIALMQQHPQIRFSVPQEGTGLWLDSLAVLKHARQPQLAKQLLHFLNQADNARRNAEFVHFAIPHRGAEAKLPETFLNDPRIYPKTKQTGQLEAFENLPPEVMQQITTIFIEATQP